LGRDQSGGTHQADQCQLELGLCRLSGSGPENEQHVPTWNEARSDIAQDGAQASPLAIADHGRSEATAGRYAKSSLFKVIPSVAEQQQRVAPAAAVGLDGPEGDC
jgi:hypothetical protein